MANQRWRRRVYMWDMAICIFLSMMCAAMLTAGLHDWHDRNIGWLIFDVIAVVNFGAALAGSVSLGRRNAARLTR